MSFPRVLSHAFPECILGTCLALGTWTGLPAEESPLLEKSPSKLFEELDKNGDGRLTAEEAGEGQKSAFERFVRVGDRDGDGVLTRAEFLSAAEPPKRKVAVPTEAPAGENPPFDPKQFVQRLDRNGDGKITEDELPERLRERAREIFQQAGTTELSIEDFGRAMARVLRRNAPGATPGTPAGTPPAGRPETSPPRGGPLFLRRLDTNGDGKLSRDELQKAGDRFADLDTDGDGQLDPMELMGARRPQERGEGMTSAAGRPPRPRRPEGDDTPRTEPEGAAKPGDMPPSGADTAGARKPGGQLPRMDVNGDGRISRDEARGRLKERFDRLDTNNDGQLDPAEMRRALQQLGEGRKSGAGGKKRPKSA